MKKLKEELEQTLDHLNEFIASFVPGSANVVSQIPDISSSERFVDHASIDALKVGLHVILFGDRLPKEVVGEGVLISNDPKEKVGNLPLGPNYWKIYLNKAVKSTYKLSRSCANILTAGHATNTIVAWPKDNFIALERMMLEEFPLHLILEILTSGRLSAADLVCLELTSTLFKGSNFLFFPLKLGSLVDFAAFQLCHSHTLYASLKLSAQEELLNRCNGNWKRLLRFLHSLEQSSDMVHTSAGNMQIKSGRYHTLLINNSAVYSCGSCICGVLGHGPEVTQCVAFTRMSFPLPAQVVHVSASHNHAAFVTQSGEVFTCGDNSSLCCGHVDTNRAIFRPRHVEALKGVPCKQVAAGLSFTAFLSRGGHVYTCGTNAHGQLGHGDNVDRATPRIIEQLACLGFIVQISAGPSYVLAVASNGTLYSFGYGANFCLGHGEQHDEQQPRAVQSFRRRGIHVARVCAGDEHAIALDSSGYVYTWGKGYCGALGHGDETDKTTPSILSSLKSHLAVQVCASKRKTFVLTDNGSVYGFGWMAFGSLGFPNRGPSDKVLSPEVLESLRPHHISQVSTGLYHTVVVTNQGKLFGFGDNERAQLGHDTLRGCLKPTEIFVPDIVHEPENLVSVNA